VTPARQNQQEKPGEPARPQQVSPAKKEKIHPPENDPKKQKEKTDNHER
jgi:hypothetical protein